MPSHNKKQAMQFSKKLGTKWNYQVLYKLTSYKHIDAEK